MARVMVKLKVMPEDVNVNLEEVIERIKDIQIEGVEVRDWKIQPVAFGLKALLVLAVMPDEANVSDVFVDEIKKIEGVGSVEIEDMELV
ncbi:MAG: elongation factor 1-beta [Archaeoglobaceae archaeon]